MQTSVLNLLSICLPLCVLVLAALWMSNRLLTLSSQKDQMLIRLMQQQLVENQSLRNQLRSPDLMTLHGLQSATLPDLNSESPVGTTTSDVDYDRYLQEQGLREMGLSDDLNAAGWDPVLSAEREAFESGYSDAGGSPVIFKDE